MCFPLLSDCLVVACLSLGARRDVTNKPLTSPGSCRGWSVALSKLKRFTVSQFTRIQHRSLQTVRKLLLLLLLD